MPGRIRRGLVEGWTYSVLDGKLLALADIGGLGNSLLQSRESSLVELLQESRVSAYVPFPIPLHNLSQIQSESHSSVENTYSSAGNVHLNLASCSGHQGTELLADATEEAKSVVLGKGLEEVLDGIVLGTGLLDELLDDDGLVLNGQGRGGEDGGELGVVLEESAELGEGAGGGIEGRGLDGGRVLN